VDPRYFCQILIFNATLAQPFLLKPILKTLKKKFNDPDQDALGRVGPRFGPKSPGSATLFSPERRVSSGQVFCKTDDRAGEVEITRHAV
jgi:hypothetical protein